MAFITETLLMDGVWWILIGASLAGLVRGFTGFGTAMVFLPFANAVMGPVASLLMLISMDIFGPLPLIPNAIRKGHPKDIALMGIGMLMTLPLGIYLLSQMDSTFYRYVVSIATLSCVALLISGLRYRRSLTTPVIIGTGGLGGFLGGFAGVPGPPVMVLYMASRLPAETIRANLILFLLMADLLITIGVRLSMP